MASAAGSTSGALLLQYLTLNGWHVDIQAGSGGCFYAVAERDELRLAASAKTRPAAVLLLFEHACGTPVRG